MRNWLIILFCTLTWSAMAQPFTNTAFKSGETLQYDLYYNWKFVWVKAGSASMSISSTQWHGQPAYRTRLLTRHAHQHRDPRRYVAALQFQD